MTTFITDERSQTGVALARLLVSKNRKVLLGSRTGPIPEGIEAVKFDWLNPTTFHAPFNADKNITSIFLLSPIGALEPSQVMQPFVELAVHKGVKRFVLLSGTATDERGIEASALEGLHTYLRVRGLDYVVLKPTWLLEKFHFRFRSSISNNDSIETIAPNGRVPFVALDDVAHAAFDAIVDPGSLPSRETFVVGPELASYTEIADIFSDVLGRRITHKTVVKEFLTIIYLSLFIPPKISKSVIVAEEEMEKGCEERYLSHPHTYVGRIGVREWIKIHKDAFS